jgi:hypothetical protein
VFPHLFNQWRGEAQSRGEREIRDEVRFSGELDTLDRSEEAQTSLKAYRVEFIGPLTEYPGTDNGRGEHQNALVMCKIFTAPKSTFKPHSLQISDRYSTSGYYEVQ